MTDKPARPPLTVYSAADPLDTLTSWTDGNGWEHVDTHHSTGPVTGVSLAGGDRRALVQRLHRVGDLTAAQVSAVVGPSIARLLAAARDVLSSSEQSYDPSPGEVANLRAAVDAFDGAEPGVVEPGAAVDMLLDVARGEALALIASIDAMRAHRAALIGGGR